MSKDAHCQWNGYRNEINRPDWDEIEYVHLEDSCRTFIEEITLNGTWLYRLFRENSKHITTDKYHILPKYYD